MTASKFEREEEALSRLKLLTSKGLHGNVLRDFEGEEKLLNYSERIFFGKLVGALYWMEDVAASTRKGYRFTDAIRDFEERYEATVYHATHEMTDFGEMLDLFYVSKHDEEWEADRALLEEGRAYAMVVNLTDPDSSEIGMIGFDIAGGGIIRTA